MENILHCRKWKQKPPLKLSVVTGAELISEIKLPQNSVSCLYNGGLNSYLFSMMGSTHQEENEMGVRCWVNTGPLSEPEKWGCTSLFMKDNHADKACGKIIASMDGQADPSNQQPHSCHPIHPTDYKTPTSFYRSGHVLWQYKLY